MLIIQVAKALIELFGEMIFVHGFVHGDPHPGNILVSPQGQGKFSLGAFFLLQDIAFPTCLYAYIYIVGLGPHLLPIFLNKLKWLIKEQKLICR